LTREFLLEMKIPVKSSPLERCGIAKAEAERQADEFLK
jgi:hypothetical protein